MFTGKMEVGNREDMKEQAIELGATVLTSVSKNLHILVIGAKPSSSKVDKARKYGCEVLTEKEWFDKIKAS